MMLLAPPDLDTRVELPRPDWSWRITWRGRSWTDNDLTGQHVAVLAILNSRDDWADLNMTEAIHEAITSVIDGPLRLVNMIIALASVDRSPEGTPEDEAQEVTALTIQEVRAVPMVEIISAIEFNR
jgi:hypothetical protein